MQKEHRREEKKRSDHDRNKYRHDRDSNREKYRSSRHDEDKRAKERTRERERERESDQKYKTKYDSKRNEHDKKNSTVAASTETKKIETLQPISPNFNPLSVVKKPIEDEKPSTSTNSDGVILPPYYNSSIVNAQKFAEQQKKRKLLWQSKKNEESTPWTNLKFSQDNDGTKANKFMRLMGIKDSKEGVIIDIFCQLILAGLLNYNFINFSETTASQAPPANETIQKSTEMLKNMEQQYEIARNITHLSRGVGLGFK